MQQIELDDQTARQIEFQAVARGLTVAEYIKSLVPPMQNDEGRETLADDLDAELEELALDLPTLPADFSRADIYEISVLTPAEFLAANIS